MRGRKPKPTKLKKLEGDIHKERFNPNEPEPDVCIPDIPDWMSAEAKREFMRIAPELKALGILSKIDRAALVGYCQAWARFKDAEVLIQKSGYIITTEKGNEIQHPAVGIANKAMDEMRKFLVEFGMSPASRPKVSAKPKEKKVNPMEKLLKLG